MLAYWLAAVVCLQSAVSPDEQRAAEWQMETQQWREARDRSLRAPDGWLAVSGLIYLEPGEHRFGSGADCAVRLTADSSPPLAGTLQVTPDRVTFRAADPAGGTVEWCGGQQGQLQINLQASEADPPDRLKVGTTTLQMIRRQWPTGSAAAGFTESAAAVVPG
jgi:uncharacterized protein (DUF1684 family)